MPELHVLVKKEEIGDAKMQKDKTAVRFAVLLATSTNLTWPWRATSS